MIVGSFDRIATETAHDHEIALVWRSLGTEAGLSLELLMSLRSL